jgi:hypothetical protein
MGGEAEVAFDTSSTKTASTTMSRIRVPTEGVTEVVISVVRP